MLHCSHQEQILAPHLSELCQGAEGTANGESKENSSLDYSPQSPMSSSFSIHFCSHFSFVHFPPCQTCSLGSGQGHQSTTESEEAMSYEPTHSADPVLPM